MSGDDNIRKRMDIVYALSCTMAEVMRRGGLPLNAQEECFFDSKDPITGKDLLQLLPKQELQS